MKHVDANKTLKEKLFGNDTSGHETILETKKKTAAVQSPTTHLRNHPYETNKTWAAQRGETRS